MSAGASAKHEIENFVMIYSAIGAAPDRQIDFTLTLLMHVVHLGRLKPPRKAAGQMDLLTVPSHEDVDMRFRQDVQALLASSGDR
jgi:hypothetical protein